MISVLDGGLVQLAESELDPAVVKIVQKKNKNLGRLDLEGELDLLVPAKVSKLSNGILCPSSESPHDDACAAVSGETKGIVFCPRFQNQIAVEEDDLEKSPRGIQLKEVPRDMEKSPERIKSHGEENMEFEEKSPQGIISRKIAVENMEFDEKSPQGINSNKVGFEQLDVEAVDAKVVARGGGNSAVIIQTVPFTSVSDTSSSSDCPPATPSSPLNLSPIITPGVTPIKHDFGTPELEFEETFDFVHAINPIFWQI